MVNIKVGDTVPPATFYTVHWSKELESHAACGAPVPFKTDEWKGKKVVVFSVPGAFTPSCHANHLPPFLEKFHEFKAKGVDSVYVVSVNDPFVLSGWTRVQGVADKITGLTDVNLAWSKQLDLTADLSHLPIGLGVRTGRYALVLDDLVVKYIGVEEDPTQVTVTSADSVLAAL